MNEATQLIAEIQERLDKLKALYATEPKRLQPGDKAPAIEWLKQLDEPLRSEALKAVEERPYSPKRIVYKMSNAVSAAFWWSNESDKWIDGHYQLQSKGQ